MRGFSAASNADRAALLQALLDLESARLQVLRLTMSCVCQTIGMSATE